MIDFFVRPPMKKMKKSKNVKHLNLMNVQNIFWCSPFYLRNIIYLAQIIRALLSNKNGILHFWKVNNSIDTKLRVTLLKNRELFFIIFSARHNSLTKFCRALFKCENKLKIGRDNYCTVLKCTQLRARVEKWTSWAGKSHW